MNRAKAAARRSEKHFCLGFRGTYIRGFGVRQFEAVMTNLRSNKFTKPAFAWLIETAGNGDIIVPVVKKIPGDVSTLQAESIY